LRPFWEMVLGGVLAILLALGAINLVWILDNVTGWVLLISILAVCYGLYILRNFCRLSFGILEILVGLFFIVGTIFRSPEVADTNLRMVQLGAGMFIIIRGFDDFALSPPFAGGGAAFRGLWDLLRGRPSSGP
jgi:hypothetical protein